MNSKITWFYCARDKKNCSHTIHVLFTGPTILFTYLKIILLQYFQFSVSITISSIQTDPMWSPTKSISRYDWNSPSLFFFGSELLSCILDRRCWVMMEEIDAATACRRWSCKLGDDGDQHWVRWRSALGDGGFPLLGLSRVLGETGLKGKNKWNDFSASVLHGYANRELDMVLRQ